MEIRNSNLSLNLLPTRGGFAGVLNATPRQTNFLSLLPPFSLSAALHGCAVGMQSSTKSTFGVCWLAVCTKALPVLDLSKIFCTIP